MKERMVLPISEPVISAYPESASLLSIIQSKREAWEWFLSSGCIQLCVKKTQNQLGEFKLLFYKHNFSLGCPWLYTQIIGKQLAEGMAGGDMVSFVRHLINQGYYINTEISYRWMAHSRWHRIEFKHPVFIYGFCDRDRTFFVADHGFNKDYVKYTYSTCTYEEFEKAYFDIERESHRHREFRHNVRGRLCDNMELYRLSDNSGPGFSLQTLADLLEDYCHSRNPDTRVNFEDGELFIYGMDVYEALAEYLEDGRDRYDVRPFHVLWEHKKMMVRRLEYLMEKGWCGPQHIAVFRDLEKKTEAFRNHIVKYNLIQVKQGPLVRKIRDITARIRELRETEKECLLDLLACMRNSLQGAQPVSPPL